MTIASTPSREVAAEIRAQMARRQPQLTPNDLASKLGRTWHYAKSRYDGTKPLDFDELVLICDWLGLDLCDLYHRDRPVQQVRHAS